MYKLNIFYMHVCIYIYTINIQSTQIYYVHNLYFRCNCDESFDSTTAICIDVFNKF